MTETTRKNLTPGDAAALLRQVFVVYPGISDWLKSTDKPKATFDSWSLILSRCDSEDAACAVSSLCAGDWVLDPYAKRDGLPHVLRAKAQERRIERVKRERMTRYHEAANGPESKPNQRLAAAIRMSDQAKRRMLAGEITPAENRQYVDACSRWCEEGGQLPQIGATDGTVPDQAEIDW